MRRLFARRHLFQLLTALVVLLLTACISYTNLYEGIACFRAEQYRSAFIRLKPEADKGHPDAQYAVGYMFYYGKGVVEDRKKALYWIRCAAKKGQPEAIEALKRLDHGSYQQG